MLVSTKRRGVFGSAGGIVNLINTRWKWGRLPRRAKHFSWVKNKFMISYRDSDSFTTKEIGEIVEVNPLSLMTIEPFTEEVTNSGSLMFPNSWLFRMEIPQVVLNGNHHDGFIGILTDEEAREMKAGIGLFRKRFDDDLARRLALREQGEELAVRVGEMSASLQ